MTLRERILAHGGPQSIASRLGVGVSTLRYWIDRDRVPKAEMVERLAELLECEPREIAYSPPSPEQIALHGLETARHFLRHQDGKGERARALHVVELGIRALRRPRKNVGTLEDTDSVDTRY